MGYFFFPPSNQREQKMLSEKVVLYLPKALHSKYTSFPSEPRKLRQKGHIKS